MSVCVVLVCGELFVLSSLYHVLLVLCLLCCGCLYGVCWIVLVVLCFLFCDCCIVFVFIMCGV